MRNLLSLVFLVGVVACVAPDASDEDSDDATPDDETSVDEASVDEASVDQVATAGTLHFSCTLGGTGVRVASDFNYVTDLITLTASPSMGDTVKWNTVPAKTLDKISFASFDNHSKRWAAGPSIGGTSGTPDDVTSSGTRTKRTWYDFDLGSKIRMTVWGQGGKCVAPFKIVK